MSSSSSERRAPAPAARGLAAAVAASLAMHAVALLALDAFPAPAAGARVGSDAAPLVRVSIGGTAQGRADASPVPSSAAGQGQPPAGAAAAKPRSPNAPPQGVRRYYQTRELDVKPGIMTRVQPEYPETAARRFLSGKLVVRLHLDESGTVERVSSISADPPGHFEQAAELAFAQARFTPGMKDGRRVPVVMTLEVTFESAAPPQPPAD